ncbi:response regulator transcription factor [Olsenella sp. YH-ols2216]|nr:response regulator transcription factor [Olsenella sp. YH-ols2216]
MTAVSHHAKELARVVYYVEDDKNLRDLTVYALTQAGIEAEGCEDEAAFKAACVRRAPDAVLLDVMLPGADGLEILGRMRQDPRLQDAPVMMLTARDTELDTVRALDAGADDYLTKPFGMMEMVSRVRVLLRQAERLRARGSRTVRPSAPVSAGPVTLWPDRREATLDGAELDLTPREFDLLLYLMREPGRAVSRDELLRRVWGWDFDGGTRTVDVHVNTLRAKLGDRAGLVETVRGVGYRLRG